MDIQIFEKGLAEWRNRHPVKVVEDPAVVEDTITRQE